VNGRWYQQRPFALFVHGVIAPRLTDLADLAI
jgi:hypothetical protein